MVVESFIARSLKLAMLIGFGRHTEASVKVYVVDVLTLGPSFSPESQLQIEPFRRSGGNSGQGFGRGHARGRLRLHAESVRCPPGFHGRHVTWRSVERPRLDPLLRGLAVRGCDLSRIAR